MVSKGMLIGVIIVAVSIGVLGFYSIGVDSSENDSSPVVFEVEDDLIVPSNSSPVVIEPEKILITTSDYSINSRCELYDAYIDVAKGSDDLNSSYKAFSGVTNVEIWAVVEQAQEKFYIEPCEECVLGPHVDQGLYNQYVWDTSLDMATEKAMITNDINPELKSDVREFMGLLAEPKKLELVIHQAIDIC